MPIETICSPEVILVSKETSDYCDPDSPADSESSMSWVAMLSRLILVFVILQSEIRRRELEILKQT